MLSNARWIKRMSGAEVLAVVPRCEAENLQVDKGILDQSVVDAMGMTYWPDVLGESSPLD
jgi:hypothetical protein